MNGWTLLAIALILTVMSAALATVDDPMQPAESKSRILKLFVDEFVPLTPGQDKFPASFEMGSTGAAPDHEKPARTVKMKHPFAMAKYEVTQELYEAVMGKNPSKWKGPRNSVEMVSWDEANDFCRKATAELRQQKLLGEKEMIRLPTEAEWEYSCRAGTKSSYSFGDSVDDLKQHAWFKENSKGEDPPVGKKKPNAWGLYDMHGYIWEWCLDAWHPDYQGAPEDAGAWDAKDAKERVARGGSWADSAEQCRSANRQRFPADHRSDTLGFRCVRSGLRDQ